MNATLKPVTNLVVCGLWIALIAISFMLPPVRWEIGILSGALGVVAGYLQARALRENAAAFGQTASMMDVRRVMTSSIGGKVAIWLLWINFGYLLVWALKTHYYTSYFLGVGAFGLARDLITLPAVFRMANTSKSPL